MFLFTKLVLRAKRYLYKFLGIPYNEIQNLLKGYLKVGAPISLIDIGAHDGNFTKAVERSCGISRCLLVEPLPHKASALRKIFIDPKYDVVESVLSQSPGYINFEVNESEATSSILKIKQQMPELAEVKLSKSEIIQCKSQTLDNIVISYNIKSIDLIKIDVQGSEHLVLMSGKKALEITKFIWIEVSFKPLYDGSSVFSEIYSLLENLDFRLMELSPGFRGPGGELLQADALFAKL
ncbi:FkbM family methyltransferase [Nodularia harveyana UHCC-0300]|uniref:FkbM family methyltransferase n=1 Tax=Nodularia harveyana UHCC-0300 TaxID=2974287 RepID=A0ABU5UC66_9CYAN|nr:FkbM family methyltransferase [Nodularia harveyana]MEA5581126.1 FkbM family methyltransferase [Nodularia harveyana UHCC-0300]